MPTTQIDDRKTLAELAVNHGWVASETTHHLAPDDEKRELRALFEVKYIHSDNDITVTVLYNSIDKMVRATLDYGDGMATQALRCIKVQGWLERYGSPSERVVAGNGRAKLLRNNRVVAEAFRQHGGDWVIRLRDNSSATISVQGLPENVQRRIVLAALGAL